MMICRVNFYCLYVVISLLALFSSAQVEPMFSSDEGQDNERGKYDCKDIWLKYDAVGSISPK